MTQVNAEQVKVGAPPQYGTIFLLLAGDLSTGAFIAV
jgi:hypothetical protein